MNTSATASQSVSPTGRRTRFDIPRRGQDSAPLTSVHTRLDQATDGVALVCAPAGYGKTTQVALWAANDGRPVVWADLGTRDNDPGWLTARLVSMLQSLSGMDAPAIMPQPADANTLLGVPEISELSRLVERPGVLVLDDIQFIDDPNALDVLSAAVNVFEGLTVVLIGRSVPHISLGRLRIEDRVVDIAAPELALTTPDARAIFEASAFNIDDLRLQQYVEETEGWPAGLRLAARALSNDAELPTGSLASQTVIAEYVRDEWLRGLDADDMDFLLRTSGLRWMSGRVCDEILGRSDSGARLHRLHRSRMLLTPLDRRDDSYRLHGLLRDVLDADFERLDRTARREIDRAASAWFESQGDIDSSVRHAVRSGDDGLTEQLVVHHAVTAHTRGKSVAVRQWLDQMPAERVNADPDLCLVSALTAVDLGEDEAARAWVRLGIAASAPSTGNDTTGETRLKLLTLKSLQTVETIGESLPDATRAYDELPPGIWHALACQTVGVLSHGLGLDDIAASRFAEGAAEAHATGAVTIRVNCRANLAAILGEQGDWTEATAMAREARQLVRHHKLDNTPSLVVVTAMSAHVEALAGDPQTARSELTLTRRNMAYVSSMGSWANVQARLLARARKSAPQ